MSVLVVIPARYASVRFPGKPLALLGGKPMIQHVYEQAARAEGIDDVVVATDDERIRVAVATFGGHSAMTSPDAASGTERVAEAARAREAAVIINVQGDEPLVQPDMVAQLAEFLTRHPAVPMASLITKLSRPEDWVNPNVVKVIMDQNQFALYFSRAPIPYRRDSHLGGTGHGARGTGRPEFPPPPAPRPPPPEGIFKHIGIYGYQRHFLLQFPSLSPTPLERSEQLEQLRALEHGYRIKLLETAHDTLGVDTPEDLKRVEQVMRGQETGGKGQGTSEPARAPRPTPHAPRGVDG